MIMLSLSIQAITQVAVAVICHQDRYLLAQRGKHQHQGGKLEFVGGKIEKNESPLSALIREIEEEIGINVADSDCTLLGQIKHDYTDVSVHLWVYRVSLTDDGLIQQIKGKEGQSLIWCHQDELFNLADKMPAANREIMTWLGKKH